jgi:hypothetical protein
MECFCETKTKIPAGIQTRASLENLELTLSFRIVGTGVAWTFRNQSKGEFLAGNRTQTG